ncbi:hypothetical protein ACGF5C_29675 [Micromonospora sp. NPDC047620]|uniref:hypothetical protein n=1 Tax=Micromonospora sp. NPDC047620 TaxID=3364251 RepID=UPI003721470B
MASVDGLVQRIDEPEEDDDGTEVYDIVDDLVASRDAALLPALEAHLDRYLGEGNFFARDAIATALARIAGVESLPVLLHTAARDLGDDQDGLSAEILDLVEGAPVRARHILTQLRADPKVRAKAMWAAQFLPDR